MPNRTWETREIPILTAIAERDDAPIRTHEIAAETGLPEDVVLRSIRSLAEAAYLRADLLTVAESVTPLAADGVRLLERGKRAAEVWPPDDAARGFLEAIDLAIAREPDEDRRSRLGKLRDASAALGRAALGEVIRQAIDRGMAQF